MALGTSWNWDWGPVEWDENELCCRVGSAASPHRWRGAQPPPRDGACSLDQVRQMQDKRIKLSMIDSLGVVGDMVGQEAGSGLWSGVSGVPGHFHQP